MASRLTVDRVAFGWCGFVAVELIGALREAKRSEAGWRSSMRSPSYPVRHGKHPGLALYACALSDRDRDEWVRLEIESNPLPICTRPQALRTAKRT